MDLSQLSPEEIQELKSALAEPPQDPVQVLASAMELLMGKVESLEAELSKVCKVVYDDFIGGIKDLASEKEHTDRIGGLKEKYGGLFGGYGDYLSDHLDGNPDGIYDLLDEHLSKLKEGEGYTDEAGDSEVQRIAKEIGDRVAKLSGKPAEVAASPADDGAGKATPPEPKEEPKEEPKKEEPKKEEAPKEEDPMDRVKKHIGTLKERSGQAA